MKQIKIALWVWAIERIVGMLLACGAIGMALWFLNELKKITLWGW